MAIATGRQRRCQGAALVESEEIHPLGVEAGEKGVVCESQNLLKEVLGLGGGCWVLGAAVCCMLQKLGTGKPIPCKILERP